MPPQSANKWLEQNRRLAQQGDSSAQVDLALAFWHGKVVPKDIDEAVSLLQRAEEKIGEDAWIELLRILCLEKDPRIDDVFRSRLPFRMG